MEVRTGQYASWKEENWNTGRVLIVKWIDKMKNKEVLKGLREKPRLQSNVTKKRCRLRKV